MQTFVVRVSLIVEVFLLKSIVNFRSAEARGSDGEKTKHISVIARELKLITEGEFGIAEADCKPEVLFSMAKKLVN